MASSGHRGDVAGWRGWLDSALISAALLAAAAGFGEFGSVAALGEVARAFGNPSRGASIAEQAGLSGTELGLGLAVVRLSSLLALVIAGLADRFGRRATVLWACGGGLALTAAAAGTPSYWWFVAVIAMARPLLSAAGAVTQVNAAEQTGTDDRAKALALVTAGYAGGAGLIAVIHGVAGEALGFRGLFGLALVPLVLVPVLGRWFREPERFRRAQSLCGPATPVIGALGPAFRRRLLLIAGVSFGAGAITGPANSFLFVYAENVRGLSSLGVAGLVARSRSVWPRGVERWTMDGRSCGAAADSSYEHDLSWPVRNAGLQRPNPRPGRRVPSRYHFCSRLRACCSSAHQRDVPHRRTGVGRGMDDRRERSRRGQRARGVRGDRRCRRSLPRCRATYLLASVPAGGPVLAAPGDSWQGTGGPVARQPVASLPTRSGAAATGAGILPAPKS